MPKKIIRLTENDLTQLIKRVIQEQSTRPFTISSIKNTNDEKSKLKTYTVRDVRGNVLVNGNKVGRKSIIKPTDKITMNEGDKIIFDNIVGWGQVYLEFKNN
jgi:hypothetical protein